MCVIGFKDVHSVNRTVTHSVLALMDPQITQLEASLEENEKALMRTEAEVVAQLDWKRIWANAERLHLARKKQQEQREQEQQWQREQEQQQQQQRQPQQEFLDGEEAARFILAKRMRTKTAAAAATAAKTDPIPGLSTDQDDAMPSSGAVAADDAKPSVGKN